MRYQKRVEMHSQSLTTQQQEAARATAGFIPSGGGLISADYYISTPEGKQKRARIPYEAIDWLVKKLGEQGTNVEKIESMPMGAQAAIGRGMPDQGKSQGQSFQGQQPMDSSQPSGGGKPNVVNFPQ